MPQPPATPSFADDLQAVRSDFASDLQAVRQPPPPAKPGNTLPMRTRPDLSDPAFAPMSPKLVPIALSAMAGLMTGGASIPAQLAAQGIAGLIGGATRAAGTGQPITTGAANEGLESAATAGLGAGAGRVMQAAAKPIMRGVLRMTAPIARKYGDLATLALEHGAMPTEAGVQQITDLRNAEMATKAAALSGAQQSGATIPRSQVLAPAMQTLTDAEQKLRAGGSPLSAINPALDRLAELANNGPTFTPEELELARKDWNDAINTAAAQSFKNPPQSPETRVLRTLLGESKSAMGTVVPGYADMNSRIRQFEGLRQALQGRVDVPASGLDALMTPYAMAAEPSMAVPIAAARAVRMPIARAGIAHTLYQGGQAAPTLANLSREAVMALLAGVPSTLMPSHGGQ